MSITLRQRPFRITRVVPPPRPIITGQATLLCGDNRELMKTIASNSVDGIVTDPPYALESIVKRFANTSLDGTTLVEQRARDRADGMARAARGFMGLRWDTGETTNSVEFWRECWRVLKPGAFVLSFGGTRTYHRMACAIEDAGFEIRDMMQWLYGSGFPKSHDQGQAIEKTLTTGAARRADRDLSGLSRNRFSGNIEGSLIANTGGKIELTTPQAQAFDNWGTALKPANEPICMARKPLSEKTVAANVLRWGTGAINIDGCMVETEESEQPDGRWPANVIHDGSDEVIAMFPNAPGQIASVKRADGELKTSTVYGKMNREGEASAERRYTEKGVSNFAALPGQRRKDTGSAARFFYCAKANKKDRAGSEHPTVKPISLLRYLCRLIIPSEGIVLDPFAGSGTTGEAAHLEGFRSIMIERESEYLDDIRRRMAALNVELSGS